MSLTYGRGSVSVAGMAQTLFAQMGGEHKLRAVIDLFVDRMFDDILIGFFFRKTAKPKLKELEYEHAAAFLGANVPYTGRPLRRAHVGHQINGGQFARRRQILRDTLADLQVPAEVAAAWLAHQESLRADIVGGAPSCL